MSDSVSSDSNRRQDFRVDDIIPLSDAPISSSEFELRKTKVGIRSRQASMLQQMVGSDVFSHESNEGVNPEIAKALENLDAKLNYLIGVNMLNDASQYQLQERPVNLSVTGASFMTSERYRKGDYVQVNLMLPALPPSLLELVGEVVWAKEGESGKTHVGVRFFYRCNEEEDSIVKYVFRRQRETIRARVKDDERASDALDPRTRN